MNPSLSNKEFLLGATACVKVVKSLPGAHAVALPEADAPVVRDMGNGLCAVYLVETDDGLIYVQNRHLIGSKLTPDGLHELGLHNLAERGAGKVKLQQHGSVFAFTLDGLFEASLILIDALWDESLAHLAPNGFVAALPARDVLAVCDAESTAGVDSLREMANRVMAKGNHLLTKELFLRRDGVWGVFD